jgi:hypothetical protein
LITVPRSGSTSVLGHTFGVDEDDVLLPVPVGSGSSRSSSESRQHDGVVEVVVENCNIPNFNKMNKREKFQESKIWG